MTKAVADTSHYILGLLAIFEPPSSVTVGANTHILIIDIYIMTSGKFLLNEDFVKIGSLKMLLLRLSRILRRRISRGVSPGKEIGETGQRRG